MQDKSEKRAYWLRSLDDQRQQLAKAKTIPETTFYAKSMANAAEMVDAIDNGTESAVLARWMRRAA